MDNRDKAGCFSFVLRIITLITMLTFIACGFFAVHVLSMDAPIEKTENLLVGIMAIEVSIALFWCVMHFTFNSRNN